MELDDQLRKIIKTGRRKTITRRYERLINDGTGIDYDMFKEHSRKLNLGT